MDAGARPNFMKVAPIIHEIIKKKAEGINRLVTDVITNNFFTTSDVANANLGSSGYRHD